MGRGICNALFIYDSLAAWICAAAALFIYLFAITLKYLASVIIGSPETSQSEMFNIYLFMTNNVDVNVCVALHINR